MNFYEIVFIFIFVLFEDQVKEVVIKYEVDLKVFGGKLKYFESWGFCKLVYLIQKKLIGFYFMFEFEVEGNFIVDLELVMKCDECVMCFFIVKMDQYYVMYVEKCCIKMKNFLILVEV